MPQAKIKVNGVPGSNISLPINALVQLDNLNIGGELSFTWAILDQPPGPADALSSVSVQNPFFTPKKEGTYLIRLIVNQGLLDEQEDRVVCAVQQLKTLERIPAAGETTEADSIEGWATASNSYLRRIDALLGDPGIFVGVNASGGVLTRGNVLRATASSVIKSGLPGQETVPGFSKALATTLGNVDEPLVVCEGTVAGLNSVPNGALMKVRFLGRYAQNADAVAAVGDSVYVSDTGTMSLTPGTVKRKVGSAMTAGNPYDVWFAGVGGEDITPIDRAYLVYGPLSTLTNGHRVDGSNSTPGATGGVPYRFRAGDAATVALQAQGFAAGLDTFQAIDSAGATIFRVGNATGAQLSLGNLTINAPGQAIVGGNNLALQGILDPVSIQDGATKGYVDSKDGINEPNQNYLINSNFWFWQRTPFTLSQAHQAVTPIRNYAPDRWYLTAAAGGAGGQPKVVSRILHGDITVSPYCCRMQRTAGETNTGFRSLIQEIPRRWVEHLKGKQLGLSLALRKGVDFSGTLTINLKTNVAGNETETVFGNYAGAGGYSGLTTLATLTIAAGSLPTVFVPAAIFVATGVNTVPFNSSALAIEIRHDPAGTAGANDYIDLTDVMLTVAGGLVPAQLFRPHVLAGRSMAGELLLCRHFYEKSYEPDTALASATQLGQTGGVKSTLNGGVRNVVCQRFLVDKRNTIAGGVLPTIRFWSPGGTLNNIWTAGVNDATGSISNISNVSFCLDCTGGGTTDPVKFHWDADSEI